MHPTGIAPMDKMHPVGPVPTDKMHPIGTDPTDKMHPVGTVPTDEMPLLDTLVLEYIVKINDCLWYLFFNWSFKDSIPYPSHS